jgi:hypothetical protein
MSNPVGTRLSRLRRPPGDDADFAASPATSGPMMPRPFHDQVGRNSRRRADAISRLGRQQGGKGLADGTHVPSKPLRTREFIPPSGREQRLILHHTRSWPTLVQYGEKALIIRQR